MLSLCLGTTVVALGTLAAAAPSPKLNGRQQTPWQSYVRLNGPRISPVAIVDGSLQGDVRNPTGLLHGNGVTTISRTTAQGHTCLVVDFGQNTVGRLSIDFAGAQALSGSGNQLPGITLAFSETLQFLDEADFTRSDNQGSNKEVPDRLDHIAVATNSYTWTNSFGCQYPNNHVCSDGLHGFRYVKVCAEIYDGDSNYVTKNGRINISGMHVNYEGFLGTPDTYDGYFQSSDVDMSQWWYDGVYTNDMTIDTFFPNNSDPRDSASPSLLGKLLILDGAKRDRDPYVGDIAISGLSTYLSHSTAAQAVRNVLADLADHQRSDGWIPPASINSYTLPLFDYPLHWIKCVHDYTFYIGDMNFLTTYYGALVKLLDTFYPSMTSSSTNLLNRPDGWGDYAFINRSGAVTYYNAYYVQTLRLAAELADVMNKGSDASRWRQRASVVSTSLLRSNWDSSVGAFYDGGKCGSSLCNTHSQDGNSFTVLANVVNGSQAQSALNYISSHMAQPYGNAFYDNGLIDGSYSSRVYAFISYFEIAARFETGDYNGGFEEIRRLYSWMASHDPETTHWEGIGSGGQAYEGGFTSMAHGWSTGIVALMSNYVLGIKPTGPGFNTWSVKPLVGQGGLSWATGAVQTPHGQINVQWTYNGSSGVGITVQSPAGLQGIVSVPLAHAGASVYVDGNLVQAAARNGFVDVVQTGGTHIYSSPP